MQNQQLIILFAVLILFAAYRYRKNIQTFRPAYGLRGRYIAGMPIVIGMILILLIIKYIFHIELTNKVKLTAFVVTIVLMSILSKSYTARKKELFKQKS